MHKGVNIADAHDAILQAERAGFKLLLIGRTAVLGIAVCGFSYGYWLFGNPSGVLVSILSLAVGLCMLATHGTRHERPWYKYVIVGLDIMTLAAAALFLPLTTGGDVPRILVFRAYGLEFLWLLLVISALALSPRLILFAGINAVLALWAVFLSALASMPVTRSWGNLPLNSTPEQYMRLLLDPTFVGIGNRVQESVALLAAALVLAAVVARARRVVVAFAAEERRRQHVEQVFGRFVPTEVAEELIEAPDTLRATVREGTVLFLDVEGFTSYAAERDPAAVLDALGTFLRTVTAIVVDHGGVVIGFGGDSVLATFGLPIERPDHARRALDAASHVLARQGADPGTSFKVRIGIATGPVAAGTVGGADRQSYTVYGSTVNLAQRLEEANKRFGTRVLACSRTVLASGDSQLVDLGTLMVRGIPDPVHVFGL